MGAPGVSSVKEGLDRRAIGEIEMPRSSAVADAECVFGPEVALQSTAVGWLARPRSQLLHAPEELELWRLVRLPFHDPPVFSLDHRFERSSILRYWSGSEYIPNVAWLGSGPGMDFG